jgi:hypothetical protein
LQNHGYEKRTTQIVSTNDAMQPLKTAVFCQGRLPIRLRN